MSLTTKYKLAEQAQRILSGGTPTDDSQISIQELMIATTQVFSSVVRADFFESKVIGEPHLNGNFIYSFSDITVNKDVDKSLFYSELPSTMISLPYDMGVYQISRVKDQKNAFVPLQNGFSALFDGLKSSKLEGRIGYYLENDRVYYENMDILNKVDTVLIKLVVPLGSVGDEDDINVPDDMQMRIVGAVIQLYATEKQIPHDEQSDLVK